MPKARTPLDYDRYQKLHAQKLSLRQIAKELGIPESTLRDNLKVMQKAQALQGLPQDDHGRLQDDLGVPEGTPQEYLGPPESLPHWPPEGDLGLSKGLPEGDQGPPHVNHSPHQSPPKRGKSRRTPEVSLGPPQPDQAETAALTGRATPSPPLGGPKEDQGTPPLYVHQGIPDDGTESPVGAEDIEGVHEEIPALPLTGIQEGHQGPPGAELSPQLVEALTTAWPELQQMLAWWRDRQRLVQDAAVPERQLERQTYHVEKRFIEAVRREADLSGESYAAIVNRAFAQYFAGKST
jgi:hypothetical protein